MQNALFFDIMPKFGFDMGAFAFTFVLFVGR